MSQFWVTCNSASTA